MEIHWACSLSKSRSSLILSLLDLEIFSPKFPVLQTASDTHQDQGHWYHLILVQHQTQCFKTNKQTKINALPFEDLKTRIILHNLLPLGNLHLSPLWTSPIVKTAANNFPPLCLSFWHILTCQSINYPLPSCSSLASFVTTYILLLCLEKSSLFFSWPPVKSCLYSLPLFCLSFNLILSPTVPICTCLSPLHFPL